MLKLSEADCHHHSGMQAEYLCPNHECIEAGKFLLCDICQSDHHKKHSEVRATRGLFSTRVLEKAKTSALKIAEDLKKDSVTQNTFFKITKAIEELREISKTFD